MTTKRYNQGIGIKQARMAIDQSGWEAAYGLELIRITQEANEVGKALGIWIDPYYPTEEEFRAAKKAMRSMYRRGKIGMLKSDGTVPLPNPIALKDSVKKKW